VTGAVSLGFMKQDMDASAHHAAAAADAADSTTSVTQARSSFKHPLLQACHILLQRLVNSETAVLD
jgi:hypothetical protein